jgi:RHS repeat-associated protein
LFAAANDSDRTVQRPSLNGEALQKQLSARTPIAISHRVPAPDSTHATKQPRPRLEIRFYQNDQLGTPRELTSASGDIRWAATYKTWGNLDTEFVDDVMVEGNTLRKVSRVQQMLAVQTIKEVHQPLRFQGQYFDEETGLHYNNFRYYDPDCGRYLSQDPIGLQGGENLYSYVTNPAAWIDPLGLNGAYIFETAANAAGQQFVYIGKGAQGRYMASTRKRSVDSGSYANNGSDYDKSVSRGAHLNTKSPCPAVSESDYAFMVESVAMVEYAAISGSLPALNASASPGTKKLNAAKSGALLIACPKLAAQVQVDAAKLVGMMTAKLPGSGRK